MDKPTGQKYFLRGNTHYIREDYVLFAIRKAWHTYPDRVSALAYVLDDLLEPIGYDLDDDVIGKVPHATAADEDGPDPRTGD